LPPHSAMLSAINLAKTHLGLLEGDVVCNLIPEVAVYAFLLHEAAGRSGRVGSIPRRGRSALPGLDGMQDVAVVDAAPPPEAGAAVAPGARFAMMVGGGMGRRVVIL